MHRSRRRGNISTELKLKWEGIDWVSPIQDRDQCWDLVNVVTNFPKKLNQTPWPEPVSEVYRPSHRRLSAKLVPTFAYRGCHVVYVTNPYDRNLGFLQRNKPSRSISVFLFCFNFQSLRFQDHRYISTVSNKPLMAWKQELY
jgi:hypothetical protein